MLNFALLRNNLLCSLTPETLADGLFLIGLFFAGASALIGLWLAVHCWRHRHPDPAETELARLQAEYWERRRRHKAVHDVAARIGVLRHNQLRAELAAKER